MHVCRKTYKSHKIFVIMLKIHCWGVYTNYVASRGGRGVRQMSTLHYNPYIVKVANWLQRGVKNFKKWLHSL